MLSSLIVTGKKFRGLKKPKELGLDLENSVWVDCEFVDCELSGIYIYSAIFSRCYFEGVVFYWASAFQAKFIDCKFLNCDLRGDFNEARFVCCGFERCEVGADNLGGEIEWEGAMAHECIVSGEPLPIVPSLEI